MDTKSKFIHNGSLERRKEQYRIDLKNEKNWFKKYILYMNLSYVSSIEYISRKLF
jgi:hypothetical protein